MQSLIFLSALLLTVTIAAPALAPLDTGAVQKPGDQNKKPSINVRANPPVGFSPLRVVVTAELKGGANDYEDFYCASVEWEWGDDTKSESKTDCDPYEAGKSEIKRRFVQEHTFRSLERPGSLRHSYRSDPVPRQVRAEAEEQGRRLGTDDGGDQVGNGGMRTTESLKSDVGSMK